MWIAVCCAFVAIATKSSNCSIAKRTVLNVHNSKVSGVENTQNLLLNKQIKTFICIVGIPVNRFSATYCIFIFFVIAFVFFWIKDRIQCVGENYEHKLLCQWCCSFLCEILRAICHIYCAISCKIHNWSSNTHRPCQLISFLPQCVCFNGNDFVENNKSTTTCWHLIQM